MEKITYISSVNEDNIVTKVHLLLQNRIYSIFSLYLFPLLLLLQLFAKWKKHNSRMCCTIAASSSITYARKQVFGYHYGKCGSKTTFYDFTSSQIKVSVCNSFIFVFSMWLQLKYRCGHPIRVTCRDAFSTLSIVNVSHRK